MILKTPSWILDTLLGDGHIDPFGRLFIEHSIKQKAYFFHKFFKLQRMKVLSANYKVICRTQIHSKTKKAYTVYDHSVCFKLSGIPKKKSEFL